MMDFNFLSGRTSKFFTLSSMATLCRRHHFWLELLYFMFFSMLGFIALVALDSQKPAGSTRIAKPDLFFMSVSTHTGSRLASINMEDLSDSQLMVLIFLMFVSGEVFPSALTMLFQTVDFRENEPAIEAGSCGSGEPAVEADDGCGGEPAVEAEDGCGGDPAVESGDGSGCDPAVESGDGCGCDPAVESGVGCGGEPEREAGGGELATEAGGGDGGRRRRGGLRLESIGVSRDQDYLRLRSMMPLGHVASDNASESVAVSIYPDDQSRGHDDLRLRSKRLLGYVALGFQLFVCISGSLTVLAYFRAIPSASAVLQEKGLSMGTFSVFTTVSSFVNCGFLPNNENMVIFARNSGFLLMVTAQILVGNTLFAPCLSLMIWALQKWSPREEYAFLWNSGHELGYGHLFPWKTSAYIAISNVAFIVVQFAMFGFLQWGSAAGLTVYQKLVAGLFQSVNARHAGETAFDLSSFSAALLVVYMVMTFLPPYTFFLPLNMARPGKAGEDNCGNSGEEKEDGKGSSEGKLLKYLLLPQAAYLVIFVVLICLTERRLLDDNFNVLTVAFEVASAYGNVGLTTGYSCGRLHKLSNLPCTDSWTSFSGRWSWKGKAIIIVVMFFGRLKRFTRSGGKAWVTL